jgi:hypothetical protein
MTNMSNTSMTLADLERLLDVYGGDRTCWPADARAAAAQLVARDAKARRLLAEAEALDRVLERAPLPALAIEAGLADRIVAAARRSPRMVKIAGAEAAAGPELATQALPSWQDPSRGLRRPRAEVRATGLLAAALVAGVVIGISNLPQQVLPVLAGMASTADRYNLAQADPFDEDVL